ncbi:DUF4012 domain-containing protein [Rhodococcus sp. NPDC003382]
MSDITDGSHSPGRQRRKVRRKRTDEEITRYRRRRAAVRISCGAAVCLVAGTAAWLGYEALQAKSSLEQARDFAVRSKDALLSGDSETAILTAEDANRYAQRARDATHSPPWRIAAAVPWLGSPLSATAQMSEVVTGLTSEVLRPVVDAGSAVSPDRLFLDGARIDFTALGAAAPILEATSEAMTNLDAQARSVDGTYVGAVDRARTQLQEQTAQLRGLLENTAVAARIAPAMLGAEGPRSYFLGFQTNVEARGSGGLLGGFAIVRTEDGRVRVDDVASNRELRPDYAPIDLGPDFTRLYGQSRPTQDFRNSNVSSHFPYAARIWQSIWQQESGELVDGVIATDPVALSYVLEVVGAVTMPDGEKITAENVVELTGSTAYARFGDDQKARKEYLETVAGKVVQKLTGDIARPRALLQALGRAAGEGRLAVWSSHGAEQDVLAATALGHTVPDDPAPYAGVVVNNLGGNKLDYYLEREIYYTAGTCDGETRTSTVTVRLTNALPAGEYTTYVAGMFDNPIGAPVGTNLTDLSLLATHGARLNRVTVDGRPTFAFTGSELGHPVFVVQVPVLQGATSEVVYELTEPAVAGEARVPVQPLVDDPAVTVSVPDCG